MKENRLLNFFRYKRNIIISLVVIVLILIFSAFFLFFKNDNTNSIVTENELQIVLFGSSKMTLEVGEEYIEPGYYAIDNLGQLKTDLIVVENNLDINKPGTYVIKYQIANISKERIVEVVSTDKETTGEEAEEETLDLDFSLIGDDVVTIPLNGNYQELGYKASYGNLDLTDAVEVSGQIDTSLVGEYKLTYKISYNNIQKELTRTIVVVDDSLVITVSLSTTSYTNETIVASVSVIGDNFLALVLPNKIVKNEKTATYSITNNGTYTFLAYNQNGDIFQKVITVNNIDKITPKVSCTATINPNNTAIKVVASDNLSGIKNYVYQDGTITIANSNNSSFSYNKKPNDIISVTVYDKASNFKKITCQVIDNSALDPIIPGSSETVIKKSETNTLKVYITKKSSYYITRVWAKDPYNQLKKYDSPAYGSVLYRPKKLLEMAINANNLGNKLVVGFNASGFYLEDTYDASSVSKYSKYNKTSVGTLVITNGKVIRNVYDKAYKTWFITGIDSNNTLRIFTDSKASTQAEINAKRTWANEVIASGIKNTFTFASPLVVNGVKSNITTSMPSISSKVNRQAICQVNTNNFVLITGSDLSRNDLINIMLDLNCQTGTNLDGGGSIALFYKDKSATTIQTIIGNSRSLTEVGYFTE